MNMTSIRYQIKKLKEYLALKTEMVNHQATIKDVASGVERSWIYYLMLLSAGLIALLGLLTNSVAVVIGAMLISPLMGPIISSGLALTIGDLPLARRAFRTIAVSVALTILVTALATLISPLKEPTAEIMARVRPNIYDLLVAVLSGIVGAVALCTKRNYLITATGVADEQDIEYSIHQLVEVALPALSPGINDPFTAMTCINWLSAALRRIAQRKFPSALSYDDKGNLRLVSVPVSFIEIVEAAFGQIRNAAANHAQVILCLLDAIVAIAPHIRVAERRNVLEHHTERVMQSGREMARVKDDRRAIEERYSFTLQSLRK